MKLLMFLLNEMRVRGQYLLCFGLLKLVHYLLLFRHGYGYVLCCIIIIIIINIRVGNVRMPLLSFVCGFSLGDNFSLGCDYLLARGYFGPRVNRQPIALLLLYVCLALYFIQFLCLC